MYLQVGKTSFDEEHNIPRNLREIFVECDLLSDWNEFVEMCLRPYLAPVHSSMPKITDFEYVRLHLHTSCLRIYFMTIIDCNFRDQARMSSLIPLM